MNTFYQSKIIHDLVYVKSKSLRWLQITLGINRFVYWFSNLVIDIPLTVIFNILITKFASECFISGEFNFSQGYAFPVGLLSILYCYCASQFFQSPSNAFVSSQLFLELAYWINGIWIEHSKHGEFYTIVPNNTPIGYFLKYLLQDTLQFSVWHDDISICFGLIASLLIMLMIVDLQCFPNKNYFDKQENPNYAVIGDNINKKYPLQCNDKKFQTALKNVSVKLKEGEVLGLIGNSGSGKSTMLDLLSNRIQPSNGTICCNCVEKIICCNSIDKIHQKKGHKIGACPQENILQDEMTVQDHLTFASQIKCLSGEQMRNQIAQLMHNLCMEDEKYKRAKELSEGNKRKLSVAMAIIGGPQLMFLDAPGNSLDPNVRLNLMRMLKAFSQKGHSIVFSTNWLYEAEQTSDKLLVLSKLKELVQKTPGQLRRDIGGAVQTIKIWSYGGLAKIIKENFPHWQAIHNEQQDFANLSYKVLCADMNFDKTYDQIFREISKDTIKDVSITLVNMDQIYETLLDYGKSIDYD